MSADIDTMLAEVKRLDGNEGRADVMNELADTLAAHRTLMMSAIGERKPS